MTKREVAEMDPTLQGATFDYSLPQEWLDHVEEITGQYAPGLFVWLYDKGHESFGRPYPLTPEGEELLAQYEHKLQRRKRRR